MIMEELDGLSNEGDQRELLHHLRFLQFMNDTYIFYQLDRVKTLMMTRIPFTVSCYIVAILSVAAAGITLYHLSVDTVTTITWAHLLILAGCIVGILAMSVLTTVFNNRFDAAILRLESLIDRKERIHAACVTLDSNLRRKLQEELNVN